MGPLATTTMMSHDDQSPVHILHKWGNIHIHTPTPRHPRLNSSALFSPLQEI